ncbi:MAG: hypothetical protein JWN26_793 [Candidatus Saccharibacteria bacterium]|nr:hypothetical protein [Candidatus Saccharibacteria bacterium]
MVMAPETLTLLDKTADNFLDTDGIPTEQAESVAEIEMLGRDVAMISVVAPENTSAISTQVERMAQDILDALDTGSIVLPELEGHDQQDTAAIIATYVTERVISEQMELSSDSIDTVVLAQRDALQHEIDEMMMLFPESAVLFRTIVEQRALIDDYAEQNAALVKANSDKQRQIQELNRIDIKIGVIMQKLEMSFKSATRLARGIGKSAIIKHEVTVE